MLSFTGTFNTMKPFSLYLFLYQIVGADGVVSQSQCSVGVGLMDRHTDGKGIEGSIQMIGRIGLTVHE